MKTVTTILLIAFIAAATEKKKICINGSNQFTDQFREEMVRNPECYEIVAFKNAELIASVEEHASFSWGGTRKVEATVKSAGGEIPWQDNITWRLGHLKAGKEQAKRFVASTCK